VSSDPGLRFRAVDAFADLAEALALAGPLVVGVDDLQWADSPSLLTLGAAARRIAGLPVALIGCLRPLPRSADLDRLAGVLDEAGARRIWLGPLPAQAVRELVADAVAAEPGPALLAMAAAAGGNPLFVTELVGALLQDGTVQVAGGRAEVAPGHAAADAAADHLAAAELPARRDPTGAAGGLDPRLVFLPHRPGHDHQRLGARLVGDAVRRGPRRGGGR
jgi:predicted ATPase